jgi:lysophospholipase L1-like esterase
MTIRNRISSALLLAAATFSWQAGAQAQTVVVVGDSLSAGYLNSSLHQKQQPRGYASVVAAQAGIDLPLPLIAAPGIPSVMMLRRGTGEILRAAGVSTGRVDPRVQAYNLAVPGATAYHALALEPDFAVSPATRVQGLTNLVLGLPGVFTGALHSQVAWAEKLDPDIVLLWVGGQDALLGLINGTDAAATDPDSFEEHFEDIMDALQGTGAKIFVANVPNVSTIPYLLSRRDAAAFLGVPEAFLEALVADDEFVTLDALGPIGAALLGDPSEVFDRSPETCFVIESENLPTPPPSETCDDYILTAAEVAAIVAKAAAYNAVIDNVETDYPGVATLVDIRGFFTDVFPFTIVDNQFLGTNYLGGIFSLDGIHPTFTAQALIAGEFIAKINATHGEEVVSPLSRQRIRAVLRSDPLVFQLPGNRPPPFGPMLALGRGDTVSGLRGSGPPDPE